MGLASLKRVNEKGGKYELEMATQQREIVEHHFDQIQGVRTRIKTQQIICVLGNQKG